MTCRRSEIAATEVEFFFIRGPSMERQNRSRSAHLNLAYSRLRPWRLHIHELVFDFLYRLQGKFLRFFGVNHEWTPMDTNKGRNRKPRMTRIAYCEVISDRSSVIGGESAKCFGATAYP